MASFLKKHLLDLCTINYLLSQTISLLPSHLKSPVLGGENHWEFYGEIFPDIFVILTSFFWIKLFLDVVIVWKLHWLDGWGSISAAACVSMLTPLTVTDSFGIDCKVLMLLWTLAEANEVTCIAPVFFLRTSRLQYRAIFLPKGCMCHSSCSVYIWWLKEGYRWLCFLMQMMPIFKLMYLLAVGIRV